MEVERGGDHGRQGTGPGHRAPAPGFPPCSPTSRIGPIGRPSPTETVPDSLLVIGGGAVGLEIGQVMSRFGAAVTIVEMGDRIAGSEEPEVSEMITEILRREGIDVHTGVHDRAGRAHPSRPAARCTWPTAPRVRRERVLVATGRRSDLAGLGRGGARARRQRAHALPVDARMRVRPGRVGRRRCHREGRVHPRRHVSGPDLCGRHSRHPIGEADYRALPRVTFTDPEIGSVGMTEAAARESGGEVRVMTRTDRRVGPGLDHTRARAW